MPPTAAPAIHLADGTTVAITPSGGSATTFANPISITPPTFARKKVLVDSLTLAQGKEVTGKKEPFETIQLVALYKKSEFTAMQTAWDSNTVCSMVVTYPTDIIAGASTGNVDTLSGFIQSVKKTGVEGSSTDPLKMELMFTVHDLVMT